MTWKTSLLSSTIMAPQNRCGHHGGGVPYPLDRILEGTTAEQLQALINSAWMELLWHTQAEDA